jgi:hypothetical protein
MVGRICASFYFVWFPRHIDDLFNGLILVLCLVNDGDYNGIILVLCYFMVFDDLVLDISGIFRPS